MSAASQLAPAMPPPMIHKRDLLAALQISDASLSRMILQGRFPPPVVLGERTRVWPRAELDAYLAARLAAREIAPF